jgi:receptor protein-tyrosine kinase
MNAADNVLSLALEGRALPGADRRLGAILVEAGKLDPSAIERVLKLQQLEGLRFGEAAMRLQLITADDLRRAIARQYELPHLLPDNENISRELVVAYEPFHRCAEQIRALRTQLQIGWCNAGARHRLLAIVSPGPCEGRSYIAANLAVAFAQLGERTLLIDADLRAPRQHRLFAVSDRLGLSAVLSGRADLAAIAPVPAFGPLALLPAGARPPNPQELVSREALAELLREVQGEYDVILLDTPPMKPFADARSIAFRTRSALVVARKDRTRLSEAQATVRELTDAGARALGAVFNAF